MGRTSVRRIVGMTVAITGASAGIGEALARQLASAGATVLAGARRVDRLHALAASSPRIVAVPLDVDRPDDCQRLVAAATDRLDVLVCNAGYGLALPIADTTEQDWQAIFQTNVLGTVSCIRAALPRLRAQAVVDGWRGQIVIVSSALARRGRPDGGAYSATKAAQLSVAEALRVELADHAIAVTSVHPVATDTEFTTAIRRGRWTAGAKEPRQTAEHVAATIIAAIRRPRAEVWPHRLSRYALGLNGFWPGLFDGYFHRRRTNAAAGPP